MQLKTLHQRKRKFFLFILLLCSAGMTKMYAQNGVLNGVFSVDEDTQVYFSQGNLQYQASTNTWRFAEHQWDYVGGTDWDATFGNVTGSSNNSISPTYSGWIDLFGWGTSGHEHGAVCYQPWSNCLNNSDYYAYGSPTYNLNDSTGQADWGYNTISNGGDSTVHWRTLNQAEWHYLLFERNTASDMRYVFATVNGVEGLILLPDTWDNSIYSLYGGISINSTTWTNSLEPNGVVFLPAAGERYPEDWGDDYYWWRYVNWGWGLYWASSYYNDNEAYYFEFDNYEYYISVYRLNRLCGLSVRLVQTIIPTSYSISTFVSPIEGGIVTGAGEYVPNGTCTVTAIPNEGYTFVSWVEKGEVVSTDATYTFEVTKNRNLTAHFSNGETGLLNGVFSISNTAQVSFSKGNLQYIGSETMPYWKFADNQWGYFGTTTGQNSEGKNVDRDLFGWGTSGYNHGAICYQPWSIEQNSSKYYAYGNWQNNLYDQTGKADWGYNAIINGGNQVNSGWRMLTSDEWNYLFSTRSTISGIRWASGRVNGVNGVILLPDNWTTSIYGLNNVNGGNYNDNIITAEEWTNTLEANGAVFLPASGHRIGTSVSYVNNYGVYWSSTYGSSSYARNIWFYSGYLNLQDNYQRYYGRSVRLVQTIQATSYIISASSNPEIGGSVTGIGSYGIGETFTLTATPSYGYAFANWTKDGIEVSTDSIYSFIVTENADYVANFTQLLFEISVSASPNIGGTTTGSGNYWVNDTCTLVAIPNADYVFVNWRDGSEIVSTDSIYTFQVTGNRHLTACFTNPSIEGILDGVFSINDSTQVFFSKGNLQYQASTNTWRFAEDQMNYVGTANSNISPTYSGWIDLFGWATSGFDHGAVCYQPWSTDQYPYGDRYNAYGDCMYNLSDQSGQADWGYNAISNGGNQTGKWRTLSFDEWYYLLYTRNTPSGKRYAGANIDGAYGYIILPDDWDASTYTFATNIWIQDEYSIYNANTMTLSDWKNIIEPTGAVFLPAAGYRTGTSVSSYGMGIEGSYWTATSFIQNGSCDYDAHYVNISGWDSPLGWYPDDVYASANYAGHSVRLVRPVQITSHTVTVMANPIQGGTVTGSGGYESGEVCTITATPNEYFAFVNWMVNDSIVSTNPTYSFTVTEDVSYIANFALSLPELHVTNIAHSAMAGGQQATISWTVQNDGTAATPNGEMWHDYVWLSVENRVAAGDNNPVLLGTFENISALNVGEYYTQTQSFNIPIDVSGEYFLFVLTDAYDCHTIYWDSTGMQLPYNPPPYIGCLSHHCTGDCANYADNRIYELSEYEHGDAPGSYYNDNFFYTFVNITVPLVPDLQVTSVIAPNNFYSGTDVNVTATISNLGEVVSSSSWTDALYFSQEPNFDSATCIATAYHSGVLAVDSSYQVTFTGYIPITVFGEAYFFVKTDIYEQVYEHIYNNNNVTMSEPVNIILTPPADLKPADLVVPVSTSTSEPFVYSFKVYNNGAGNPNVTSWVDKVYISAYDTLGTNAILLKTHSHYGNLTPASYYSINGSVSLPSSVNSGFYYVYVVTDATDAVFEYLYEDNNTIQSSLISVTSPDLQITEMTAPEQITSGYPINLSYTLINNGDGAISNRSITDKIYISNTESLDGATWIAETRHNVNLPVGQSMTVTCNATAPTGLTDGTFHLIVVADGNNEIHESNEGNNTLSQYPMPVMHQPLPDLQPVSLNLPSTIQAGEAVNVDFDITNLGDLDLLNSNCTFNVYALMGNNEILCPVQSQTLPLGSNVSIGIGQTVHFVRSILVPASVTSACTTFKLYADKENRVMESNENNNTITTNVSVIDCPLPDLTVSNFTLPAVQAGTEAQVSFTVANQGTADFIGSFGTAVYANVNGTQILCPLRQQIAPETTDYSHAIGESLQFTLKILVPPMVTSACNSFSVVVDATNTVLETNENNNTANAAATVTNYPFNLTTQAFTVPSTVTAGETTNISWTVKNTGTCPNGQIPFYIKNGNSYSLVEGDYLPSPWKDRIYLSDDASLDNNDTQLLSVEHNSVLQPNGTYSVEQTVTLPYNAVGLKYLLCVSDATELTFDNNRSDNVVVVPVTVELGTLPDLHITTLTVEPVLTSDNAYWVHYTVTNEGERVTQRDNWMDAFYISENYAVTGAFQLGSKIHNGALAVGASYTDSIEILVPNGLDGDYFLLGLTDATNLVYEYTNEGNNLLGVTVTVVAPDPCDLIAIQPEFPNYAVSGEEMTVSWQLRNIGANPAEGRVRNAVYLSTDADWSSDDVMLGYANVDINIAANQQQACSLSGSLTGIAEGNYYVIVKANILNALNESSYENNICVSLLTTEVGFPLLAIGEQVDRSMTSDQYIYYKLQVGPEYEGQTLSCILTTMEQQVANGLYLSHEAVPTLSQYDFGKYAPYAQEIEILIPALEQGDYYLLAKGSTQNGSPQQVSIATSIINFEILHIDADHGSNTGSITTKVTGAKFDSIMDFRLVQGGEYLPAEKVFFSNSTETYTTFDLVDMPAGTYAMEAELPGGIITIKGEAFTIEEGLPAELAVNIVAPSSVRRGNTFPVNIEYGNIGTTDLNVSGFVVVSRNGHPIGFTSDELAEELTERVFSTAEANGNPDVLRPGYRATKTILVDANTLTQVSIQVYAIRKQY